MEKHYYLNKVTNIKYQKPKSEPKFESDPERDLENEHNLGSERELGSERDLENEHDPERDPEFINECEIEYFKNLIHTNGIVSEEQYINSENNCFQDLYHDNCSEISYNSDDSDTEKYKDPTYLNHLYEQAKELIELNEFMNLNEINLTNL